MAKCPKCNLENIDPFEPGVVKFPCVYCGAEIELNTIEVQGWIISTSDGYRITDPSGTDRGVFKTPEMMAVHYAMALQEVDKLKHDLSMFGDALQVCVRTPGVIASPEKINACHGDDFKQLADGPTFAEALANSEAIIARDKKKGIFKRFVVWWSKKMRPMLEATGRPRLKCDCESKDNSTREQK